MTKARDLGDNAQNTKPKVINAKADLIVGTGSDAADRLAVGSNGETLVADSSTSTGLRWQGNQAAGRNTVLNGGFDIWQRGTSFTTANNGSTFGPDRWNVYRDPASGGTVSRQTSGLTNFLYACRVARDSGNTSTSSIYIWQNFESQTTYPLAGKTIVVSYYARAGANYSPTSSNLGVQLYTGTGTDQNILSGYTGAAAVIDTTQAITTTWTRYSHSVTLNSNVTEICPRFYMTPTGTAGANDWFEITGIQIEIGSVPTTFTRAGGTLAGELAACQRYYYRIAEFQIAGGTQSAAENKVFFALNSFNGVPMRTTPTAAFESTPYITNGASNLRTVTAVAVASKAMIGFTYDSTRLTDSYSYMINAADAGRAVSLSAEL